MKQLLIAFLAALVLSACAGMNTAPATSDNSAFPAGTHDVSPD